MVVFSSHFSTHLQRLETVLKVFQEAVLQLNFSRCLLGSRQLKIVGHLVDQRGIQPDTNKVRGVLSFPMPTNLKSVKSFLGLCSYFHCFVANFISIVQPLTKLCKKDTSLLRNIDQATAFSCLKEALTSAPILDHFDNLAPIKLRTDANRWHWGCFNSVATGK